MGIKIKVNTEYNNGINNSPNQWVVKFFPYGDFSGVTTVKIKSNNQQFVKINNGFFSDDTTEKTLVPNNQNVIQFDFKATKKGTITFSDKNSIISLGLLTGFGGNGIFASGNFNAPNIQLDFADLPNNIYTIALAYLGTQNSKTFVNQSYNELLKYSKLTHLVIGNPNQYPNWNYTSLTLNSDKANKIEFLYLENVYTDKSGITLINKTAPLNNDFYGNLILTKNAKGLINVESIAKIDTDNKNIIKGKLSDLGERIYQLIWFNSNLVSGKLSNINLKNFNTIDIGGTNIKGYDSGKIYNDLFVLLDISRTGMSATDTDLMLIDIANSLTTTLRRTIKIKARTSASDSAVTTLQSKNVAIQIV